MIYIIHADLSPANMLEVELHGKTDQLVTQESDHWADIKNIMINGVPADAMLLSQSEFEHAMPNDWVEEMRARGIDISAKYRPGTSLRLNGVFRWPFSVPFSREKIIDLWLCK